MPQHITINRAINRAITREGGKLQRETQGKEKKREGSSGGQRSIDID